MDRPLTGVTVVSLAVNLPGPAAAHRFHRLGASVTKVEPPSGDPLALAAPGYYAHFTDGQQTVTLNLKDEAGRRELDGYLRNADLLITSHRPRALAGLGLDWDTLHVRYPQLSQVAIVGSEGNDADTPGHDLTYQAQAGTIAVSGGVPVMPILPVADLGGAERAVADGLAALFRARMSGEGQFRETGLAQVVDDFAASTRFGLSGSGAVLGGGFPLYGMYPARDGYIAVAAIEPHFAVALAEAMGLESPLEVTVDQLTDFFREHSVDYWSRWALEHELPVTGVRDGQTGDGQTTRR
ncbi:Putative L-carnitine dehydratase/bile acid-inducible protein F [Corynebacterium glyciniphilum AJ 3170]|uniref:Putative L-carnitine dehydratase/bile acid-inducible protein F n=1 Tax=Corynebacterium glyciniphilum AJ 3170 TaxID=1404245 RepID=X5EAT2_9CORY|nr:CoA transferase [Corynebacterium glyciniphilum]AHW64520.1 Putative L-carnitine dehydratase/bile acid-inducible protein F [Corynebacterium glyciniphilum AJ 3170]